MNNVKLYMDMDNIRDVHTDRKESGAIYDYAAKLYFDVDGKFFFPGKKASADPFYVLRWLLREMRLSLSTKVKERSFYFNAEQGQYIFLSTDNDILKLRFVTQKPKANILQSVFAVGKAATEYSVECKFKTFFAEIYEMSVDLWKKFRDVYPQGGYVDVLGEEINHSAALYCKCAEISKKALSEMIG